MAGEEEAAEEGGLRNSGFWKSKVLSIRGGGGGGGGGALGCVGLVDWRGGCITSAGLESTGWHVLLLTLPLAELLQFTLLLLLILLLLELQLLLEGIRQVLLLPLLLLMLAVLLPPLPLLQCCCLSPWAWWWACG